MTMREPKDMAEAKSEINYLRMNFDLRNEAADLWQKKYGEMKCFSEKLAYALDNLWRYPHNGLLYREDSAPEIEPLLEQARGFRLLFRK